MKASEIMVGDLLDTQDGVKMVKSVTKGMICGRISINYRDGTWTEVSPQQKITGAVKR